MSGKIFARSGAGLSLLFIAVGVAQAQSPAKRISPADGLAAVVETHGATPRASDGHPDLTGMWTGPVSAPLGLAHYRSLETLEPDQAVMQRGNTWNRPIYKPEYWEKVHNLDFSRVEVDPHFTCQPIGVPRQGPPVQIIQTPMQTVLLNGEIIRVVPTDGRERDSLDADFDNFGGVPNGRWDGDTLVVESVGFNGISWLQFPGFFHTQDMKLTERLWRKGDVLFYRFTVDDPEVLAQPWTSDVYVRRLTTNSLARLDESAPCKEQDLHNISDPYFRG